MWITANAGGGSSYIHTMQSRCAPDIREGRPNKIPLGRDRANTGSRHMQSPQIAPRFVRIADATMMYSLSRATFDRALAAGDLTRYKRGSAVLLDVGELDAWIRGEQEA